MKTTKTIIQTLRNTSQPLSQKTIKRAADRLERLDSICKKLLDEREKVLGGGV
ncbi:protein of unknown function [Pseudodesulfovibrio profundus]|uniref:Uncharacterized protein n=1 Tax=Pseudodesulfovibrio profundus TaxID=57320 RepID=A0A2C8FDX0_9BACT|nr:hypothetical protein [Pseudodesulfovibrio profundus]SOB60623.1 protein of unknown function [Pseudodesulfovibrio profundus]